MAKLLVFRFLKSLSGKYAGMHLKNAVDDVSLKVIGTPRTITKALGGAQIAFAEGLKDLRLLLSHSKTQFAASSRELAEGLVVAWSAVECRNLRTDATAGKRRRVTTA